MRNRSAIWVFTILLTLACLYQLSFSWVTMGVENDALAYGKANSDQTINKFISDAEDHGIEQYQSYINQADIISEKEVNAIYDSIIGLGNSSLSLDGIDSTLSLFNEDGQPNLSAKEVVIAYYKQQVNSGQHQLNQDTISVGGNKYSLFVDNGDQDPVTRDAVVLYYQNQYKDSVKYKGTRVFIDGGISEIVKQKVISENEQNYLQDHSDDPTYPLLGITYQKCKNQQLGLGLDLQGGMSVTLEVDIPKLVDNLAGNPADTLFRIALDKAKKDLKKQEGSADFLELFNSRVVSEQQNTGSKSLYRFFWRENNTLFKKNNPEQVKEKLKELSIEAVDKTQRIIESRINKFGVSQPNIQRHPISGRLQIELPGAKDKNRVRKLLQSTASLEFWDCYHNKEWMALFQGLDKKIYGENNGLSGKIFNQKFALMHDGSDSPYIGLVEKESEMQMVDSILNSELAEKTFNFQDVKFLWMNKKDDYDWKGKKINGFALLAIEIPVDTKGKPRLDGEDIENASQSYDDKSNPSVMLRFKPDAADDWENWTGEKVGKMISIVMDDLIYSAPYIRSKIGGGNTEISGGFETIEEAQDLANILKAGSLPAPAIIVDEAVVGPSLGEENIQSGLWSFVFAFILVLIYMIFYYNRAGLVANVALIANIFFIIGTLASLGAALTLPGIAGLVLTIGMSVDANVLIYERIKEELRKGKGIKLAVQDGYKHAYSAIVDANITSLLTAIVLAYFGSGPIQGFATTLIIGVFTSLFSAIFITRLIFSHMLDKKWNVSFSNNMTEKLFTNNTIQFLNKRKLFYAFSTLVVIAGVSSLFMRGLDGGVEFTGGRTYRVEFSEAPNKEEIRKAIAERSKTFDADSVKIVPEVKTVDNAYTLEITTKYLYDYTGENAIYKVDSVIKKAFHDLGYFNNGPIDDIDAWESKCDEDKCASFLIKTQRSVDSQISSELVFGSILAIVISLLIIFMYIAFRFKKWQFGLGALVAMFHDVLVVLGLFSLLYNIVPFSMEIDQAFIAAILTVVGYSINDTVVVFDRIREYTMLHKRGDQNEVVNKALNSTLSRTLNTSLSTFLVLLTIFIFGGESIRGFSFALMVGVVVGTYSSVCIATPSVIDLTKSIMGAPKKEK